MLKRERYHTDAVIFHFDDAKNVFIENKRPICLERPRHDLRATYVLTYAYVGAIRLTFLLRRLFPFHFFVANSS